MVLDDFLDALAKCPDDELSNRFHIGENYTILFRADFKKVSNYLDASDRWKFNPEATSGMNLADLGDYRLYDDISQVVTLQALSWVVPCFGAAGLENHIQERGYNMSFMMVHDILDRNISSEGVHPSRIFANAVRELILYAKEKSIPICLPKSSLTGNKDEFISYP